MPWPIGCIIVAQQVRTLDTTRWAASDLQVSARKQENKKQENKKTRKQEDNHAMALRGRPEWRLAIYKSPRDNKTTRKQENNK